jgi:hypothetical protein
MGTVNSNRVHRNPVIRNRSDRSPTHSAVAAAATENVLVHEYP